MNEKPHYKLVIKICLMGPPGVEQIICRYTNEPDPYSDSFGIVEGTIDGNPLQMLIWCLLLLLHSITREIIVRKL